MDEEPNDIVQRGVDDRRRAHLLVSENRLDEARVVATAIKHPWYRCQALTAVAARTEDPTEAREILLAALDAAAEQKEPNRIASVSAWPLSLLVHLDRQETGAHVDRLLVVIGSEPHSIRRADGLLLLMNAIYSDQDLRGRVLAPLLAAIQESRGWKIPQITRDLALVLAAVDRDEAERVLSAVPETREIRQARRLIAANERLGPSLRIGR